MGKKIKMDKEELVKEHKNLVKVLKSPSHKDDMKEAKKQEKELKGYEGKADKKEDKHEKHEKAESKGKEKKESKMNFGKGGRTDEMMKKSHDMSKDTEHETSRDHKQLDYDAFKHEG